MKNEEKISYLNRINNVIYYQRDIKKDFFEEWYYRNIFINEDFAISVVPGIFTNEYEEFAYIQVRHSKKGTYTIQYKMKEVEHGEDPFYLKIGESYFYKDKMELKIDEDELYLKGNLKFEKMKIIKETKLEPNIMGPLAYLKNLKTNQAILSMHHKVKGNLIIDDVEYETIEGVGYSEKNWGNELPETDIKVSCNTFEENIASLFMEIGKVKFGPLKAKTHSCIFIANNEEYRFSTYNLSRVKSRNIYDERYVITFENKENKLEAQVYLGKNNIISEDTNRYIPQDIIEELDSGIKVKLYDKNGKLIFRDNSNFAGVEITE